MSRRVNSTSDSAFTLIEVLSVVGIILLLAGLLFPAAQLVRESARRRQAQQQAQSLVQAIKQYRSTYGQWPGQTQDVIENTYTNCPASMIDALTNNPRNIVFLRDMENVLVGTAFMDPWNRAYIIAMDENGDGVITNLSCAAFTPAIVTNVSDRVAVASWGPDPANTTKRVYSWARQ